MHWDRQHWLLCWVECFTVMMMTHKITVESRKKLHWIRLMRYLNSKLISRLLVGWLPRGFNIVDDEFSCRKFLMISSFYFLIIELLPFSILHLFFFNKVSWSFKFVAPFKVSSLEGWANSWERARISHIFPTLLLLLCLWMELCNSSWADELARRLHEIKRL